MVMFPLEVLPVLLADVLDALLEDLLGLLGVAGLLEGFAKKKMDSQMQPRRETNGVVIE